ncbi:MAG TPA: transketolase [Longimicrobiales bacterium]|nr:transketolase [Longimicrobiales bacterium]
MRTTDHLFIDTLRFLAADAVERAGSGHPGMPMGAAPMAYVLWSRFLDHNPANPLWPDRDRFILSAGHGSALLYGLLHLSGYDLPLAELERLRQWGSATPGHPEHHLTPGVEVTTGPLGQGIGMSVGMAAAERMLGEEFNEPGHRVVDHYTYAIVSDGDLMEGISYEACSLAGHLRLGKLVCLYDENRVTIDGPADLTFTEDVGLRFEAQGWHVQLVEDGNDLEAIHDAIAAARDEPDRPSLVRVRTLIGFGSPKEGTAAAHGEPLGENALEQAKRNLGWPVDEPFFLPPAVREARQSIVERGERREAEWRRRFEDYRTRWPDRAAELERRWADARPNGWLDALPGFEPDDGPMATRAASGRVLTALESVVPELVGGSADLARSTKAELEGEPAFDATHAGRNVHYGVREHAMAAITNGMAMHGGLRPFAGTFLIFSDYMRPSLRIAALMDSPSIFVFSHDSVGLGGDGPTHQPVEHLPSLRAMPNMRVIRPADANETVTAWRMALEHRGPTALVLTRQDIPVLPRASDGAHGVDAEGVLRGAYVVHDGRGEPDVILIATGSEVHVALEAAEALRRDELNARVVSMPCWEVFADQPQWYRDEVLPPQVRARVAVEAASPLGWERWVGEHGLVLGMRRFGASAPGEEALRRFGFTPEMVADAARTVVRRAATLQA